MVNGCESFFSFRVCLKTLLKLKLQNEAERTASQGFEPWRCFSRTSLRAYVLRGLPSDNVPTPFAIPFPYGTRIVFFEGFHDNVLMIWNFAGTEQNENSRWEAWGVSADDVDQKFIGVSITLQACIVGWAFSGRASSRLCPICRSDTWRKYSRRKFEVFLTHYPHKGWVLMLRDVMT